jgi:hypothetical protein
MSTSSIRPLAGPTAAHESALRLMIRAARGPSELPLRVERRQGQLRVALEDPARASKATTAADSAATAPETQAHLIDVDLRKHLDLCTGSRKAMPHLAAVENGIHRRGLRSLDDMPLPVLRRASGQLAASAPEPLPEGLALLQARLDVAIVAREEVSQTMRVTARDAPSSFFVEHKLEVNEASMTDFLSAAGDTPPR